MINNIEDYDEGLVVFGGRVDGSASGCQVQEVLVSYIIQVIDKA